ncbi:hypothetical protein WAI453_011119 [Rhynchosporium graminicola]|uniref:Uncharacterized protein n=1 Tax=Rhynchosporium graminicola TaxID=2792576 RepID=A0A1E1LK08_9HELO|nr:uncharacterized protein RCO7_05674 [Rhynchosporium commune]
MFFQKQQDNLPPGWSRRHLTFWDNNLFAVNDSPTIAWVYPAGSIDRKVVSEALKRAIKRRIPWLNACVALTQTGSPPYELHVPSPTCEIDAYSTSSTTITKKLDTITAWTPNDSEHGLVEVHDIYDSMPLNPRTAINDIQKYLQNKLPLLHLHFAFASDAILVSLSWSHAVMDAVSCAQLVAAWEQEIQHPDSCDLCSDTDPSRIFDFTEDIEIPSEWHPQGWLPLTIWSFWPALQGFAWTFIERYRHPLLDGSIYIPSVMMRRWRKLAAAELENRDFVSSNDLVSAWVFKYAWGGYYHGDLDWNTIFTAVCARGRHIALPLSLITNLAKSCVAPPIRTIDLREQSLAKIALRLRKSLEPFTDEHYVAKFVTQEYRRNKQHNGYVSALPEGYWGSRSFGITSWARQGLGNFTIGEVKPVSCLTYNAQRRVATIIDTSDDWRVDFKLSARQWNALKARMAQENESLRDQY